MDAIIMLTPKNYALDKIIEKVNFEIKRNEYNQIIIFQNKNHIFINKDNSIISEYDTDEMKQIKEWNSDPDFYLLEYNDFNFIKTVLLKMDIPEDFLIDDEHNHFYKGDEFIKKISSNEFDWRK